MKILYYKLRILSDGKFNFEMEPGFTGLDEVVITARKVDSNVRESTAGLTKLNIQDIKTLPTMMGEVDILKSLQLLPGVSSVGEGSSGINVRGGRTDQNLTLLNDVPVFNVSHALGFISAFNQDIIQNFSLYIDSTSFTFLDPNSIYLTLYPTYDFNITYACTFCKEFKDKYIGPLSNIFI